MNTRSLLRVFLKTAVAISCSAATSWAQTVTYSTSGTFGGGTNGTVCTTTSCTSGGFTLSFVNASSASYTAPTLVDLGQFLASFSPSGGTAGLTAFSGVTFTLTIAQTAPSGGTGGFFDGITGSLAYNPSSSSLVWSPISTQTAIGVVTYTLVTDNTGNINIQAPTTAEGNNPNPTSVKANVTATPEPATFLLLAPGLVALGMVRRRRSSNKK
jgi:hypothetical protein